MVKRKQQSVKSSFQFIYQKKILSFYYQNFNELYWRKRALILLKTPKLHRQKKTYPPYQNAFTTHAKKKAKVFSFLGRGEWGRRSTLHSTHLEPCEVRSTHPLCKLPCCTSWNHSVAEKKHISLQLTLTPFQTRNTSLQQNLVHVHI